MKEQEAKIKKTYHESINLIEKQYKGLFNSHFPNFQSKFSVQKSHSGAIQQSRCQETAEKDEIREEAASRVDVGAVRKNYS